MLTRCQRVFPHPGARLEIPEADGATMLSRCRCRDRRAAFAGNDFTHLLALGGDGRLAPSLPIPDLNLVS